jgi:RNA polymerase sigma-70 factor, ECF subfamily
MLSDSQPFTTLLMDWSHGNKQAEEQVMGIVYRELHRLAARYMRGERQDHTLEATALVNELYIRLCASEPVSWQNRAHFFAVAAQQLRRILIDHARDLRTQKRGGGCVKLSLTQANGLAQPREEDLLEVDEALCRLEALDPRAGRVVELRFFGGLTEKEAAEALGISVATLKRDWEFARAWLIRQLRSGTSEP